MSILEILLLAVQFTVTYERLTVLRGHTIPLHSRKLICVSENDGSGLVWNNEYDLHTNSASNVPPSDTAFKDSTVWNNALEHNPSRYWKLTASTETSMGPVYDRRWEGFKINMHNGDNYTHIHKLGRNGSFAISIRGVKDVYILLCADESYSAHFCYWIIIGGWDNSKSMIRTCSMGLPNIKDSSNHKCGDTDPYKHEPLSPNEWRTFLVRRNENTRTISIYNDEKLILKIRRNKYQRLPKNNIDYTVFIASKKWMQFKLHLYDFLYTTVKETTLEYPINLLTTNFCIQMAIGLCAECKLKLILDHDADSDENFEVIEGSTMTSFHGLPMWQYARINKTVSDKFTGRVTIKLVPLLDQESPNPLWAVADTRVCPPADSVRTSSVIVENENGIWPKVTCQKLFYNESVVVNSMLNVSQNLNFDDSDCPEGKLGPYCSIDCKNDLNLTPECTEAVICGKSGCMCPPGFMNDNCNQKCPESWYGHNCNQVCGKCFHNDCNFRTGLCEKGCDNTKGYKLPPFCKKDINAPSLLHITLLTETSVRIVVPIEDDYKLVDAYCNFIIKNQDGDSLNISDPNSNDTHYIGIVNSLELGVSYTVYCELHIKGSTIDGKVNKFTIPCESNSDFELKPTSSGLMLKIYQRVHSCPAKWYNYVVKEVNVDKLIYNGSLSSLPHTFDNLKPYTVYEIIINRGPYTYYKGEIRTLEAAPSNVINIKAEPTSNSVKLTWDSPEYPNGDIQKYEIVIEITNYKGCFENGRILPKKKIEKYSTSNSIQISHLHPYATYYARIKPCNSKCGNDNLIGFSTDQSEIPTEIYRNLRINDHKLYWDLPEDCTTITGDMYTKLIFRGISKAVANNITRNQTKSREIDIKFLYGAEKYQVWIFTIRGYNREHNSSAFQTLEFNTLPKAPPPVRDLEIFEVNRETYNIRIHLRWKELKPPTNGKLKFYKINLTYYPYNYGVTNRWWPISPTAYCKLWEEYICFDFLVQNSRQTIQVSAINIDVSEEGEDTSIQTILYEYSPESPKIFRAEALAKGVVNLTWSHPWRTGGKLSIFFITVTMLSTKLTRTNEQTTSSINYKYWVQKYEAEYTYQLHLLPSSTYTISINAVTVVNMSSETKFSQVETPSAMEFKTQLTEKINNKDSTILLDIPVIENVTIDSVLHVIVIGSNPCDHYRNVSDLHYIKANIGSRNMAWHAATLPANQIAGTTFLVGDNKTYNGIINCPLNQHKFYVITVILESGGDSTNSDIKILKTMRLSIGEVPTQHTEAGIISLILLCFIATAVVYYFYRRKTKIQLRDVATQEEITLTENTQISGNEKSNSNRILAVTPDTPHKESLPRDNTPQDSASTYDTHEDVCSLVKVKNFEDYVREAIVSGLLDEQFDTLPRGQTRPWDYGKLPQNKSKNRYANLIAYDDNRVILEKLSEDPHSDYINANYINGYKKEKCYIATQGPKLNTINDFWRMIWQEQAVIICMLTDLVENGKTKCEQYWPDIGKKKVYGELTVLNANQTVFADFTFHTFKLTYGAETRQIKHLHYTAWPDHGTPFSTHSVVTYLKKLLATSPGNGPVVVHCSAGVGRTGTIILCDICLRQAAAEGNLLDANLTENGEFQKIDVFSETKSIRSQRANMVDTKQQYLFAHLALVECLLSNPTSLPCDEALSMKIEELKKQLTIQQQSLEKAIWKDEALRPATGEMSLSVNNRDKNRFPELASANIGRVYLKRYPSTDDDSDYISAVHVDGVKLQNQYIATQLPLPKTLSDFWRMVDEYKPELIVELQPPDPDDKTCCSIVPSTEFKPVPYINIKVKECTEHEYYTLQKLSLENQMARSFTEQQITVIRATQWKAGRNQAPPPVKALVTLWQATQRIARGTELTIVMCHDGVTGCGLYLALSILLDRMSVEQECDVCLAIRAVRRSNRHFVQSLEQMEYLYDAVNIYLKYFETYANFT